MKLIFYIFAISAFGNNINYQEIAIKEKKKCDTLLSKLVVSSFIKLNEKESVDLERSYKIKNNNKRAPFFNSLSSLKEKMPVYNRFKFN